jgi:LPS export ABC transporter permease LptF
MKILRNYILKDFFTVFIFSYLILTTVFSMGSMMQISDWVVRKGMNIADGLKLLCFGIPRLAGMIIPPAFLFGVLLVMGRLIADNEIIAIRIAGVSLIKILNIFLIVGVIFSLALFLLNDRVIPSLHYRYNEMKHIFSRNITALIEPGVFLENFENYILYVGDKKENKLKNVYIFETSPTSSASKTTFAKEGEFIVENNILKIKLEDGFRDEAASGDTNELYRLNFKVFFMDIPIQKKEKRKVHKKPADMSINEINKKIEYLESKGIDVSDKPVDLQKEFHKRISFSLSTVVFVLLGFSVSLIVKHREKSVNFFVAGAGAFLYYMLFILGDALIEEALIAPALGMWLPNILITLLGSYILFTHAYSR